MATNKSTINVSFNGKALKDRGEVHDFIEDLKNGISRAARTAVEDESNSLSRRIKKAFENQSLRLKPLNKDYLKKKIKQGFDPRIGFRTGQMVKAIRFFKDSPTKFFIGIRRQNRVGKTRKSQSISMPAYARIFEFGSRNQPARPVFMPMLRVSSDKYRKSISRNLKVTLNDIISIWGAK